MIAEQKKQRYYQALIEKNAKYDGLFYVGVKTTGIFCHASCPAKKPNFENCEFFETAKEALLAAYRPCQRCKPLLPPHQMSSVIKKLIEVVEKDPTKRWKDEDFRAIGVDESTARRQFKKRFNMTFIEYARSRRMGLAMKQIKLGASVIDSQLEAGYDSASGFCDAFSKIMGTVPNRTDGKVLSASWIDSPLGPMIAIADNDYLYLLEFIERRGLEREIERLRKRLKLGVIPGSTKIIEQIKSELMAYFSAKSFKFITPIYLLGSEFQKKVWHTLQEIQPGKTLSYLEVAKAIDHPKAFRAVANANGANQLAIIIPCHRVINANGALGGYGGGISRKDWLLKHEKNRHTNV
ncbi:trifunctional transcriptional activator/DNA repair protein Ada/methylated-DNA--[protein]-cysteine S-methyltransferase [Thiotrichales bacterium 19S3-7]|nr:trifunctional transcriptional activator/DNA repair protein Ada/methylated-DNA--[protein]-cysteine S-methyltransferase [Thiotrichales bacterium 19S3-7]MCF6801400.1 trifunctional transcriptional activator/DNA repair protein Ada/methylated-DNA--[protein]-cysteine S-methyltransferase [Thiotrichales bacterium 19S3-11]